jgi:hypothetical protein
MNIYTLQGQASAWISEQLTKLGFKNIKSLTRDKTNFRLFMYNGDQYELTLTKVENDNKI